VVHQATVRDDSATANAFARTPALHHLLEQAERTLDLRRVWLFGSRSRGDARDDSDIDLAFEHDSRPEEWADFVNSALDQAPVLLDLDLVDLRSADPGLRERILREGTLLHG
jgi:predicted nucleotidyltransferase